MFSSTNYYYDAAGQLIEFASRFADAEAPDRTVKSEYDKYGRLARVVYDDSRTEEYVRDTWGKILKVTATDGETVRESTLTYDYFDRLIEQIETVNGKLAVSNKYAYNNYGQRVLRETQTPLGPQTETREYDEFGRLVLIESGSDKVEYQYNNLNQVATRTANGIPVAYTYTAQGQLQSKSLGDGIATQEYFYSPSGRLIARADNGERVDYQYDAKGQLLAVVNAAGETVESYTYDPAGNILEKMVDGETTTFTYDAANQLVTSVKDGETTTFQYDAAGRLVKSGATEYSYGWMDKVIGMTDGTTDKTMNYYINGQLASVNDLSNQTAETFTWDGLALIQRNAISYLNEPAVTGGNPILADGKALFEDHLGSSLGVLDGEAYEPIQRTAFGEVKKNTDFNFYTGKPEIEGLGYAFLFRNYQARNGKWLTTDPLGYPDGWNNLAYVNNGVTTAIDWLGAWKVQHETYTSGSTMLFNNSDYSMSFSYTVVVGSGNSDNASQTAGISINATFSVIKKGIIWDDDPSIFSLYVGGGSATAGNDGKLSSLTFTPNTGSPLPGNYSGAVISGGASVGAIQGGIQGTVIDKSIGIGAPNITLTWEPKIENGKLVGYLPAVKIDGILVEDIITYSGSGSYSFTPTVIE